MGAVGPADRVLHSRHAHRRGAGRGAHARLPGALAGERRPAAGSGGRGREELRPAARPALPPAAYQPGPCSATRASRRSRAWSGRPRTAHWWFRRSPARSPGSRGSPRSWRSPPMARSSRPPRQPGTRPAGRRPANSRSRRPRQSRAPISDLKGGGVPTPYGNVIFWMVGPEGHADPSGPPTSVPGLADYVYVQAPWSPPGFINPVHAWDELRQLGEDGPLLVASYALLFAIVPVGVLFGLLASRRLVRRVRRLERATVAVADGDYTVTLPASGRDEVGRLEANFTTMTRQLGSALAAERQRATGDARAAERARIAREIHDAISQHLFGLRMIAAGMRRADPGNEQARAIERHQRGGAARHAGAADRAAPGQPGRRRARPGPAGDLRGLPRPARRHRRRRAWTTSPSPRPSSTPCCASPRRHAPTPSGTATPAGSPCP